jgi:hypothetical protein
MHGGPLPRAGAAELVALTMLDNAAASRPAINVGRTSCRLAKPCSIIVGISELYDKLSSISSVISRRPGPRRQHRGTGFGYLGDGHRRRRESLDLTRECSEASAH